MASVQAYNKMMISPLVFNALDGYTHMILHEPDAIVIRDEIDYWCNQPLSGQDEGRCPGGEPCFSSATTFQRTARYVIPDCYWYVGRLLAADRLTKCLTLILQHAGNRRLAATSVRLDASISLPASERCVFSTTLAVKSLTFNRETISP
jgi:hypothetical protein